MGYFIQKIEDNKAFFNEEESYHLLCVLRKKIGDIFVGFDGNGNKFKLKIIDNKDKIITCEVLERIFDNCELEYGLFLALALSKKEKFEFLLEKSVELGVKKIFVFKSEFSVVKITDIEKKIERYKKIILSAVKQSERSFIPEIFLFKDFDELIKKLDSNYTKIMLHPYGNSIRINNLKLNEKNNTVIFIGPEGGFSEREINIANTNNFLFASLGNRILRLETAGILAIGYLMLQMEKY